MSTKLLTFYIVANILSKTKNHNWSIKLCCRVRKNVKEHFFFFVFSVITIIDTVRFPTPISMRFDIIRVIDLNEYGDRESNAGPVLLIRLNDVFPIYIYY